nr:hypothetical protein [Tanacetum cinerariifolium]
MDAVIQSQGAMIKTLEIRLGKMSKVLHERGFGSLPSSTAMNLRDQVKSISTTIEADSCLIRRIRSAQYVVFTGQDRILMEEKIVFTSVKPASSLIKRVYMLSLRERMEFDLEAMLMGETLVLNRSLALFFEEYIKVNDLNEPIKVRINQGDDLMPTIEEGFEFTHTKFFPLLYVNVMSIKFYSSIIKDKIVYKGNNVVRALTNVPIFLRTFFVVMDFAILKNMDAYRDEGIGDVIVGEPFLRDVGIKIRRFEGMITNYNGNNEVTYQMVQSHPRIKCHTNEQCNKILPLLKVSDKDKMNGILHPYQKLKGFYKGVLNFGPDYTEDAKMEEWLTREHISVHEMK